MTLTRCGELPTAQLLCGRLDAEGIECFIPDEIMATQTWHLTRAIGGIRVQVRQADLARAQQVLENPGVAEGAGEGDAGEATSKSSAGESVGRDQGQDINDDGSISAGDRAAYRAMRVALVSLWLLGLIHPYSLLLAVRALRREDVTAWGRRRAWIALVVSLLGCTWISLLVARAMK